MTDGGMQFLDEHSSSSHDEDSDEPPDRW